ncbi:MAG: immune inhibitor A domain-containing protein, partial [Nocardioides sp.]
HDLGLPDEYDTSGNTGGAENSTGFWTLMSQSRGTGAHDPGIGDRPMPMSAWDKFQLGWLDYEVVHSGRTSQHALRPGARVDGSHPNGLIVMLPDKKVTFQYGAPCSDCGEKFFYSDKGDDLDNTMTRDVDSGGALTAKVRYSIEEGWDYAFLEASSDGGDTWTPVPTNVSYAGDDQSGFNGSGAGISGTSHGAWVDLTATVPDGTTTLRWRYQTDGATALNGFQVDNITLDGQLIGGAETDEEGWALNGFETVHAAETKKFLNAYFVDNRQYVGRDTLLRHVYNFGFKNIDRVEFFRYNPGALISYWDTSYSDINVGDHPGGGEILPVDAHRPSPTRRTAPSSGRGRCPTTRPSPRGRARRRRSTTRVGSPCRRRKAVALFNDKLDWWFPRDQHTAPTRVTTSPVGTAWTCRRPGRRSAWSTSTGSPR